MSGKAKGQVKATVIKAADPVISAPIKKSDAPSQVTVEEAVNAGDWIEPPMMLEGLKNMVTESSILPQCIRAYKNNIAGFGIGIPNLKVVGGYISGPHTDLYKEVVTWQKKLPEP